MYTDIEIKPADGGGFYVIWRSFTANGRRLGYRSYYCYTRQEAEAKAEELRNAQ